MSQPSRSSGGSTLRSDPAGQPRSPPEGGDPTKRTRPPIAGFLLYLLVAGLYFAAGKLGLKLAFVHHSATAVWPPSGIALAAFLLLGLRLWPAVYVGAFLVNLTTKDTSIAAALGIATGNTLEGIMAAVLVNRFARGSRCFERPRDVFVYALLAGLLSTAVSATVGVGSLVVGQHAAWSQFASVWWTWWLGDAAGILVIAPVLILWATNPVVAWTRRRTLEAASLLVALCLVSATVFEVVHFGWRRNLPLGFLSLPIIAWAAFRFGPRESATVALLFSAFATVSTLKGFGPYATGAPNESLLLLQGFMIVISVTGLAVAAAVSVTKRTAESLREQAAILVRSTRELERFAYVASHDMQEPLRMVSCYSEMLAERYRGKLEKDADEFIGFVLGGVNRMKALIQDLLTYAKVAFPPRHGSSTDFNEALEEVLQELRASIEECGAVITNEPLPTLPVERSFVLHLLQNLVGNAIKFRGKDPPRVRIAAERRAEDWLFSVQDNGIGIDRRHWGHVFDIFRRLQHWSASSGTGAGLAICKKIVEQSGGRIWVESRPDEGSTFFFTLPAVS